MGFRFAWIAFASMTVQAETEILPLPSNIEFRVPLAADAPPRAEAKEKNREQKPLIEVPNPGQSLGKNAPSPALPPPSPQTRSPAPKRESISRPAAPSSVAPPATIRKREAPDAKSASASQDHLIQAGIAAFKAGQYDESYRLLRQARPFIEQNSNFGLMELLGLVAMRNDDEALSIAMLSKAADHVANDPRTASLADEPYTLNLLDALIHFRRLDEAEQLLGRMPPSQKRDQRLTSLTIKRGQLAFDAGQYPAAERYLLDHRSILDAGGLELLGWAQHKQGKHEQAVVNFEAAYRMQPSRGSGQGLVFGLHSLGQHQKLLHIADEAHGPLATELLAEPGLAERLASGEGAFSVTADGRLIPVSDTASSPPGTFTARVEPIMREKRGTAGEGRLTQQGIIATGLWERAQDRITLTGEQQNVDDDVRSHEGQSFYALWQHHAENGLAYRLGLGRSLSGGAVSPAMLGEIGLGHHKQAWGLGGRLFRRGNEESLLALSGLHDPVSGSTWGRVLETGLALDGHAQIGPWNALASLSLSELSGQTVADNRKTELYARALHPIGGFEGLAIGPELYASHFERNLSAFEPGHGGYFSPARFIKLGAVASYETRIDTLSLSALAGVGWSESHVAAADGNPLTGSEPDKYPASNNRGLSSHGRIEGMLPLGRAWKLGFKLGAQSSPDYSDWQARLYAQRDWRP